MVYTFTDVIPEYLLKLRASDLLDIMGFSSYPEPVRPDDMSDGSIQATFGRLNTTLGLMDKVAQKYGKFDRGRFAGQYVKQCLAVEYATAFQYPDQISFQQLSTQLYFGILKAYPWVLGSLWYEPTYANAIYEGLLLTQMLHIW